MSSSAWLGSATPLGWLWLRVSADRRERRRRTASAGTQRSQEGEASGRGGIPRERFFDHFARVHARAVDRAAEELEAVDQPVPAVEKQDREHLVVARRQPHREVVPRCVRRGHDSALPDADRERVARAGD